MEALRGGESSLRAAIESFPKADSYHYQYCLYYSYYGQNGRYESIWNTNKKKNIHGFRVNSRLSTAVTARLVPPVLALLHILLFIETEFLLVSSIQQDINCLRGIISWP